MISLTDKQDYGVELIYANDETLCLGGVRSGKSLVITEAAIQSAFHWETDVNGIMAAPTFGQLERNLLEPWRDLAPKGRYEEVHDAKDPHIDCRVGRGKYVKIYLASGKRPDTIEGATVGWVAATELQQMAKFWTIVRRRVSDKAANRLRWFGDGLTEEGWLSKEIDRPGITELRFSTFDNLQNLSPGFLAKMRDVLTPRQWDIYILGKFAASEDAVFSNFLRAVHAIDLLPNGAEYIDRRFPVIIGQDFNLNPMASVMCQYVDNTLKVIGELIEAGDMQSHSAKLAAWCIARGLDHKDQKKVFLVPDATGGRRNQGDGRSNLYILQQAGFTVRARPQNPLRVDTDQAVAVLLENQAKERRLFLDKKRAPKTIDALASLKHADREAPDNVHSHPIDALKYVAYYCAPVQAPGRPRATAGAELATPPRTMAAATQAAAQDQKRYERRANVWQSNRGHNKIPL